MASVVWGRQTADTGMAQLQTNDNSIGCRERRRKRLSGKIRAQSKPRTYIWVGSAERQCRAPVSQFCEPRRQRPCNRGKRRAVQPWARPAVQALPLYQAPATCYAPNCRQRGIRGPLTITGEASFMFDECGSTLCIVLCQLYAAKAVRAREAHHRKIHAWLRPYWRWGPIVAHTPDVVS
jgi:hypothetical protein